MDKVINERYKKVYQTMNQVLKYYKKFASQEILDGDMAIKEANELIISSPVPTLMMDLLFAIQNQIGREIEFDKNKL